MKLTLSIALLALLAGCASSGLTRAEKAAMYDEYVKKTELEQVDRITTFRFYGWSPLDEKRLILKTSAQRAYLITLQSDCWNLDFANGIKVNQGGSSSLHAKFDSISVADYPERRCFIESIHKLTKDQAKEIAKLEDTVKQQ